MKPPRLGCAHCAHFLVMPNFRRGTDRILSFERTKKRVFFLHFDALQPITVRSLGKSPSKFRLKKKAKCSLGLLLRIAQSDSLLTVPSE